MWQRLREDVHCVFDRDPAARNVFEILTTYPGIHALLVHRFSHRLWRIKLKWLARFISTFARWMTGIEIHPGATIGRRFFIDHGMGVVIGETAVIGDDCTLYHGVTLGGTSWQKGKRHPTLCNNIVVGAGAKILGPVTIHDDARIGSNSVVLKDVPAHGTVVGVPGRLVEQTPRQDKELRRAIARKLGFDAYGTTPDMPDPEASVINRMLEHIQLLDCKIEEMSKTLNEAGLASGNGPLPSLQNCELYSVAPPEGQTATSEENGR
ncbi:MAG: serine O-acetyltransferase [Gammaproteobacteria bacterium]|nr:serine O-acetyltransferase [Gammaproteobacteria bacterium]MCP5423674.1 serine O-acetyltransferase [Gammaproteobacteria bacterium]